MQTKILRILRSPQFFAAILLLFFIESAWVAISAAYPMVFDENVHFNLIQAYAHQWGPLWPAHSAAVDPAGAVVRDPSYLYHYLLSFPYRLISAVTNDQMMQIIDLRFINIFLFGGSLIIFRRLLLKTKVSPAIVHSCLLFFVLTPVVPLLAGQINYDNLVMVVTAACLIMAVSVSRDLSNGKLPSAKLLSLLSLCLLGSLVQFEFLPILAAVVIWLGLRLWQESRSGNLSLSATLRSGWQASWRRKLVVVLPLVIATSLFLQMYGVNLVRYHTLTPACNQVLTQQQCAGSGSWVRSQNALAHKQHVDTNPLVYGVSWTYRMFIAMFYTSSGGASPKANYLSVNPLPLVFAAALGIFMTGLVLLVKYRQAVLKDYQYLGFLFFASVLYSGSLLLHNYLNFVQLGQKFAIQGRYLFPVALPCMLIIALAFRQLLNRRQNLKAVMVVAVFVVFLQGGGALTYITDSNQAWYWQNKAIVRLNQMAQHVIRPLMLAKEPLRNFGRLN